MRMGALQCLEALVRQPPPGQAPLGQQSGVQQTDAFAMLIAYTASLFLKAAEDEAAAGGWHSVLM